MQYDQDWPNVWPAAASFRSSVVPMPIRMGTRKKPENRAPFKTIGNLELLKIPNFLHLTPSHIQRHCEAIKSRLLDLIISFSSLSEFFTPFPPELKNNQPLIDKHLPVTLRYSDFLHQGSSLRDMRARVVTMVVKVPTLGLDERAKDKLIRLVGDRYDPSTDTLTIVTDRLVFCILNQPLAF
jgi:small subunit ribosomal protein S35